MKNLTAVLTCFLGIILLGACESTPKSSTTSQAATTRPYQGWTTAQLKSQQTQLMLASSQPGMTIDPVNGGSAVSQHSGINRQLDDINAELALRAASKKPPVNQ